MRDSKRTASRWVPRQRAETYNEMKARLQNDVAVHALAAKLPRPFPGKVRLRFVWFEADRHRDPDNVRGGGTKIVMDALVQAGVLTKDDSRFVQGFDGDDYVYGEGEGVAVHIRSVVSDGAWSFRTPNRLPELPELQRAEARGARRALARRR